MVFLRSLDVVGRAGERGLRGRYRVSVFGFVIRGLVRSDLRVRIREMRRMWRRIR
jgi:hypothetical protein